MLLLPHIVAEVSSRVKTLFFQCKLQFQTNSSNNSSIFSFNFVLEFNEARFRSQLDPSNIISHVINRLPSKLCVAISRIAIHTKESTTQQHCEGILEPKKLKQQRAA